MCVYIHIYTLFKLERNTRNNNNNSNASLPSFCAFFFRVIYNIHTVTHEQQQKHRKNYLRYFYGRGEKKNGSIVELQMINIISNSKKKNYERNTAG